MPSRRILFCRVVRFNPSRSAAPPLPAIRPDAALKASRITVHSACRKLEVELLVTPMSQDGRSSAIGTSKSGYIGKSDNCGLVIWVQAQVCTSRRGSIHTIGGFGIGLIALKVRCASVRRVGRPRGRLRPIAYSHWPRAHRIPAAKAARVRSNVETKIHRPAI